MNFDPVPEHEMLRESVRDFFERELPEERIREMDRARRIPRELWKRFAVAPARVRQRRLDDGRFAIPHL